MERSDAELLEASRRGEREAFGALIERYQAVVCAASYSRTGDRALGEDVAQDTFLTAWRKLDQLREPERLGAWLCGIARNLARKARQRSAREEPLDLALVFEGANPLDQAVDAESSRVVRDALLRVPETYRDVLVMYYRDQRSARDVAAAQGLSEAAVLQRLARGRQYLADMVTELAARGLRAPRPSRNLAALVLAALPAFAPSRADAASGPSRGPWAKLAAVAAAAALAGGAARALHTRAVGSSPAAAADTTASTAAVASTAAARSSTRPMVAVAHRPALLANTLWADHATPDPDELPVLDRATMQRTALYSGPARGAVDAPVTIVVFTDLTCVYCGNALGTIDQLWDEYPGKLRLVMKQLPVHTAGALPAEAALAADAEGKFWELHDLMIAHQDDLSRDRLIALADQAGLDAARFRAALDQHTYAAAVRADVATATELGIRVTPAFVINGRREFGNLSIEQMSGAVEQALAEP